MVSLTKNFLCFVMCVFRHLQKEVVKSVKDLEGRALWIIVGVFVFEREGNLH